MARPKQIQPTTPQSTAPKKKLSLNEFRAWLSGVEEMQADDWTPDSGQWRIIRSKIEEVIDAPPPRARFEDGGYDEQPRGPIRPQGPSAFVAPTMSPAGSPSGIPGVGGKTKTADIDTSNKPYASPLE